MKLTTTITTILVVFVFAATSFSMLVVRTGEETVQLWTEALEERLEQKKKGHKAVDPNIDFGDIDWENGEDPLWLREDVLGSLMYSTLIPEGKGWRKSAQGVKIHKSTLIERKVGSGEKFVVAWLIARFSEHPETLRSILATESDRNILLVAAIRADALIEQGNLEREVEPYLKQSYLSALKKVEEIDRKDGQSLKGVKSFVRAVAPSFRLVSVGTAFPAVSEMTGRKIFGDGNSIRHK